MRKITSTSSSKPQRARFCDFNEVQKASGFRWVVCPAGVILKELLSALPPKEPLDLYLPVRNLGNVGHTLSHNLGRK